MLLFAHGLRLVFEDGFSYEKGMIVCLSLWLGLAFQERLVFPEHMAEWAHTLLDNGMTSGGLIALALTGLVALKGRRRKQVALPATVEAVSELHGFLDGVALASGWDRSARNRLQLAGEEAWLYLSAKERDAERPEPLPIQVSAWEAKGVIEVEFGTGPDVENLEQRVSSLPSAPNPEVKDDAGLRILHHLVKRLRHEQFYDRDYLLLAIDNRP